MREFVGATMGVKEIAVYVGVSEITVYRLVEKGQIPAKKVGAQWRFVRDEIDRWLRKRN